MDLFKRIGAVLLCAVLALGLVSSLAPPAEAAISITSLKLTDFRSPYAGEAPAAGSGLFNASGQHVYISSIEWTEVGTTGSFDAFSAEKRYYVTVTLMPQTGYAFPSDISGFTELSLTRPGETSNLLDKGFCRVKDGKLILETVIMNTRTPKEIGSVAVTGYKVPALGDAPQSWSDLHVDADAPYTVDKIEYRLRGAGDIVTSFENGKTYYAIIVLRAKYGYIFPDKEPGAMTSCTLNGSTAQIDMGYGGRGSTEKLYRIYTADFRPTTAITAVSLGNLVKPVEGEPPQKLTVSDSAPYTISSFYWWDPAGVREVTDSDTFEAGKVYYIHVELTPKMGYAFPASFSDLSAVTLGGSGSELDTAWCRVLPDGTLKLNTVNYTAAALITSVDVTGLVKPVPGAHPENMTVSSSAPYTLGTFYWYNSTDSQKMSSSDTFEEGKLYFACIKLAPKSGYSFPSSKWSLTSVTIDGSTAEVDAGWTAIEPDGTLRMYTRDYGAAEPVTITIADVAGLVKPVVGEHPEEVTVASDAPYTIKTFYWHNYTDNINMTSADTFEEGKVYFIHVELSPKSGYVFPSAASDMSSVTIDGSAAEVDSGWTEITSDGVLKYYSLNYTSAKPITEAHVTGLVKPVAGKHPADVTVAEDAPYTISKFYWYNRTDGVELTASDVFEKGKIYFAHIELAPKKGYTFPKSYADLSSVTVGGSTAEVDSSWCDIRSDGTLMLYTLDYAASELITDVNVDGFVLPIPGEHPAEMTVADDAPYTVSAFYWYNNTDWRSMTAADVFEEGKEYFPHIQLAPKSGYTFPDTLAELSSLTINGSAEYVDTIWSGISGGKMTLYSWNYTAVTPVTGIAVDPTALVVPEGERGSLTPVVAPDTATDKTVSWTSSDDAVAAVDASGNVLGVSAGTVTITVTTTDGGFTASCVVTVAHKLTKTDAVPPTCTAPGGSEYWTCSACGKYFSDAAGTTEIAADGWKLPALGHDWGAWTVTTPAAEEADGEEARTCARCGAEEKRVIPKLGHTHALTKIEAVAPTCVDDGLIEYWACAGCGKVFGDAAGATELSPSALVVPALGHDYTDTVTSPTCTAKGYTTHTCSRCGDTYTDAETAALGHEYKAMVTEPTCTEKGYTTCTCTRCGDSYTDAEIAALGHDYMDTVTEPTCTDKGYTTHVCARCGDTCTDAETAALGHDYTDTVTAPTCTKSGFTTHTCARCGDAFTDDETEPTGHAWGAWETVTAASCAAGGEEKHACAVCGAAETRLTDALGHDYTDTVTAPTCTESGYTTHTCARCGHSFSDGYIDAPGHDWGDWAETKPATETEAGEEARTCARCGAVETRAIPMLAHTHVTELVAGTPATCTAAGEKEHYVCAGCGLLFADAAGTVALGAADVSLPPLGHEEEIIPAAAPTCTEPGLTEGVRCARCGEIITPQAAVDALGHDYDAVETSPTCTEKGYTTHTCARCGDVYRDAWTDALGHDFGEWTETKAATETEEGEKVRACARCGESETRAVPALGHDHSLTPVDALPASCTADGYEAHYFCKGCGQLFADAAGETAVGAEDIRLPALGHDLLHVEAREAAVRTDGNIEYWRCERCGRLFADEKGETELAPADVVTRYDRFGDVNGDGKIDSLDASLLLRYIVGLWTLDEDELLRADADRDGSVTAADAARIIQK